MPEVRRCYKCLQINAPEWYQREDFLQYLQQELRQPCPSMGGATWHRGPRASEFSDLFLWFDDGEGSDSDLVPADIWQELCRICKKARFDAGVVWITNLHK
jgi:hypothetical protein